MAILENPALNAFLAALSDGMVFGEVQISHQGGSFELRHVADRGARDSALDRVEIGALRALANHTGEGRFRPLKSAPSLRRGWLAEAATAGELECALAHLYPGALADWFMATQPEPPVTSYRSFVNRQTGMYRISQMLTDGQVRDLAHAGCHRDACLKRRLWGGPELAADNAVEKSVIPCLEPCAVMLEFARKSMRLEQVEKAAANISEGDLQTLLAAVDMALANPAANEREGDFNAPDNPRRLRRSKILLERWLAEVPKKVEK
ncbi:MAG TPA: DR2241 family protein [Verrucomicrobiae bacterium]